MRFAAALFALALLGACTPPAPPPPAPETPSDVLAVGDLRLSDAWVSPTPASTSVAAAYLSIANAGAAADRLLAVSSPRAGRVEVHEIVMEGDLATMRPVAALDIPAGATVTLAQGGLHLMFFDVDAPFAPSETVPVELRFERAGVVNLSVPVRDMSADQGGEHPPHESF